MRRRGALGTLARAGALLLAIGLPAGSTARADGGSSFETQTAVASRAVESIEGRVHEIEALRAQATRQSSSIRLSCIDEHLKLVRSALANARVVFAGWSLAKTNAAYLDRSIERLLVLKLYATVHAGAAQDCADASSAMVTLVKTEEGGKQETPPDEPLLPPPVERPPLASPY